MSTLYFFGFDQLQSCYYSRVFTLFRTKSLRCTETELSSTPCVNYTRGEHLNIFAFPVFLLFLVLSNRISI